jgi:IPT/TIG domain
MGIEGPDNQMKLSFAAMLLVAASFAAYAQQAMPRLASAEPQNGKVGDEITVTGENLAKDSVAKLYLTDGTNDVQVDISEQTATTLKFKIPAKAKPGRLALMVLTAGKEPKLIEQPVKVTIEE